MKGKCYRKTKNGKFEAYVSDHCRFVSLGTYSNEVEAEKSVYLYKAKRLEDHLNRFGHTLSEGVIYKDNYIVFDNGDIFNFNGEIMHPSIDRCGYLHGLINGYNESYHRIIALCFIPNPRECNDVNHINGIKTDNRADNLEWCTRSENALHSFRNGLQTNIAGIPIYSEEEKRYMLDHCGDSYLRVAEALDRNPETVRKYLEKYRKEKLEC